MDRCLAFGPHESLAEVADGVEIHAGGRLVQDLIEVGDRGVAAAGLESQQRSQSPVLDRIGVEGHQGFDVSQQSRLVVGTLRQALQIAEHALEDFLLGRRLQMLRQQWAAGDRATLSAASSGLSVRPPSNTSINRDSPLLGTYRTTKWPGRPTPSSFNPRRRPNSM